MPGSKEAFLSRLQRQGWNLHGGLPEIAGAQNDVQTRAHISLWPHGEGVGGDLSSADAHSCFLKLIFHPVTAGLSLAAPQATPHCSSPMAFIGFPDGMWVRDRISVRRMERWGTVRWKKGWGEDLIYTDATAGLYPCSLLGCASHLLFYNFMLESHCAGVAEV